MTLFEIGNKASKATVIVGNHHNYCLLNTRVSITEHKCSTFTWNLKVYSPSKSLKSLRYNPDIILIILRFLKGKYYNVRLFMMICSE